MGWATGDIERLPRDETVAFRTRGGSVIGRIESGQLCTVEPVADVASLRVDDIVLCRVGAAKSLHPIQAIQGQRFQIGNDKGDINGWTGPDAIFGRCVKVEP
ncbi:MAG: hypothetical protein ACOY82_00275 [Pseudomonadota bacterium]